MMALFVSPAREMFYGILEANNQSIAKEQNAIRIAHHGRR